MSILYSFDFYFFSLDSSTKARSLELINSDKAKIIGKVIVLVQEIFCFFSMIKELIKYIRKKGKKKQEVQEQWAINVLEIKPNQAQGIEECKIQIPQDPNYCQQQKDFSSDESFQVQASSSRFLLMKDKNQKFQPSENQNTTQVDIAYTESQNQTKLSNKIYFKSQLEDQEQNPVFTQKKVKNQHNWLRQIAKRLYKRVIIKDLIEGLSQNHQSFLNKKNDEKLNPPDRKDNSIKK